MVRVLTVSEISMNAQDGQRRSKLQKYPPRMFGVQQRVFVKAGWNSLVVGVQCNYGIVSCVTLVKAV